VEEQTGADAAQTRTAAEGLAEVTAELSRLVAQFTSEPPGAVRGVALGLRD
jgi:methyl-accepting chemotaxis protein